MKNQPLQLERPDAKDDDYDPHSERVVENPISDWETLVHFLKGCIGTGILSMPIAFKFTGLIIGTILTWIIGLLCSYGLNLLIKTEYVLCKRFKVAFLSYPDAMKVAFENGPAPFRRFAPATPYIVNIFLVVYQLGLCTAYIVFVSMNVKSVVERYSPETQWAIQVYMVIFFIGCLAISYVPNLKIFAPFSLVANLFIVTSLGIIFYFIFQDFPNPKDRALYQPPLGWVRFVGICFFALESVGVVVSAEFEMKNPKHFGGWLGVFNVSIMIVTFLYWLVGFLGYVKYGDCVHSTIPLDLPDKESVLPAICRCLVSAAILISFGLQLYPAFEVVWNSYVLPRSENKSKTMLWVYTYLLRTAGALLAFGAACASDKNLDLVLNVLGVMCITMLGFTFPGLMHICTYWPGSGWKYWVIFTKDVFIIIGGIGVMILGLYVNISSAIDEYGQRDENCAEPAFDQAHNYRYLFR